MKLTATIITEILLKVALNTINQPWECNISIFQMTIHSFPFIKDFNDRQGYIISSRSCLPFANTLVHPSLQDDDLGSPSCTWGSTFY
jgi:hypothetical protein